MQQTPEGYSVYLGTMTGITKIEVINNEVIAAGQSLTNPNMAVLVHCRVTNVLEFTLRSPTTEGTS